MFPDVESAALLRALDERGIYASSGSACTSLSSEPSHVLLAMGIPRNYVFGALRITFGYDNTPGDVGVLVEAIPEVAGKAVAA